MNPKHVLTIKECREQSESAPLYVVNTSSEVVGVHSTGADIYISVREDNDTSFIKVPQTWVPIDVSESASRRSILSSRHFLESVRKGLIAPVSVEYAEQLQEQEDAMAEYDRLASEDQRILNEAMNPENRFNAPATVVDSNQSDVMDVNEVTAKTTGEKTREADANFQARVNRMNTLSTKNAWVEVKRIGKFSRQQVQFMIANLNHKEIVDAMSERLAGSK